MRSSGFRSLLVAVTLLSAATGVMADWSHHDHSYDARTHRGFGLFSPSWSRVAVHVHREVPLSRWSFPPVHFEPRPFVYDVQFIEKEVGGKDGRHMNHKRR